MLLEAVALLRARGRAVTCRVIGDGPLRAGLAAQAERLGIGDAVEFRSDVHDRHDLYSLVKSGRVFAFPSEREGFGIAVLEALACGLPVVTTSAPDNLAAALVERSGRGLICAPSAAALADAVGGSSSAETARRAPSRTTAGWPTTTGTPSASA